MECAEFDDATIIREDWAFELSISIYRPLTQEDGPCAVLGYPLLPRACIQVQLFLSGTAFLVTYSPRARVGDTDGSDE